MRTWLTVGVLALGALCMTLVQATAQPEQQTPTQALQVLIDATPTGGTLHLAPGVYTGPATIDRTMTLEGDGQAVIQGDGHSTVLSVAATAVTLRGLRVRGSGDSHDRIDAGIMLQGDEHRVENNDLEDVLLAFTSRASIAR